MSYMTDLAARTVGKFWSVTGPDSRECTAIPHQEEVDLGTGIVYGNAADTYANAPDSVFIKALNTPTYVPPEGAIGVNKTGQYGHTYSVMPGTDVNTLTVLEQNNPLGSPVRTNSRNYAGVYGFFTPRALAGGVIPTPSATDVPKNDNEGVVNGQGLRGHTEPNISSPWPWHFDDNEHIAIVARTQGENVTSGPYAPSSWWYLVYGTDANANAAGNPKVWVSDAFVRTKTTPANVQDYTSTPATPDPTPVSQYSPKPATGAFGVDVSSVGQGKIDWDKLNGNVDFAVARAGHVGKSYGGDDNFRDPQFDFNRSEALRLGIPFGAYWFCYPSLDPKDEAQAFANVVGSLNANESLWADIETDPDTTDHELVQWCADFKAEVERLTKHKCRGYYNVDFNNRYPGLKGVFGPDGVWAAKFDNDPDGRPFPEAIMHQYTSSGKLPGITGAVDLNVFWGTADQFKALGTPISVVVPQPPAPTGTPGVDHTLSDKIDAQTGLLQTILSIVQHILSILTGVFK